LGGCVARSLLFSPGGFRHVSRGGERRAGAGPGACPSLATRPLRASRGTLSPTLAPASRLQPSVVRIRFARFLHLCISPCRIWCSALASLRMPAPWRRAAAPRAVPTAAATLTRQPWAVVAQAAPGARPVLCVRPFAQPVRPFQACSAVARRAAPFVFRPAGGDDGSLRRAALRSRVCDCVCAGRAVVSPFLRSPRLPAGEPRVSLSVHASSHHVCVCARAASPPPPRPRGVPRALLPAPTPPTFRRAARPGRFHPVPSACRVCECSSNPSCLPLQSVLSAPRRDLCASAAGGRRASEILCCLSASLLAPRVGKWSDRPRTYV
jgi:hypothetical protein